MAAFLFTKAILDNKRIDVYNNGNMRRDFTYVDDIVEGIYRITKKIPEPDPEWNGENPDTASSFAPYKIFNIGNNQPVQLMEFIETLEEHLGRKAEKNLMSMQPGDVSATYADVDDLMKEVGFKPKTDIKEGVKKFVEWYRTYYQVE